jgi:hypothetical protein
MELNFNIMQEKESKTNKHFTYSMIKSVFRITAGTALAFGIFEAAGCFLIVAEVLGILEEF